jgi:hypothetical protein
MLHARKHITEPDVDKIIKHFADGHVDRKHRLATK